VQLIGTTLRAVPVVTALARASSVLTDAARQIG
jgi:hypothetical protein